jgi:hypothetical protein
MMSLPAALEMGDPFCPEHGYIELSALRQAREDYWSAKTPEAERDAYARARASGQPPSFGEGFGGKVAICWSGDPKHENAAHRDCPLGEFLRLAEVPGVRLHSVQVGPGAARFGELGCWGLVEDRGPEITNFADTARILGEMDLVVTVDTSVGHLAGAMGIPTWLLVNRRGQDFRLGMEGETTEWYPGHRLFRRDVGEGWDAVMGRAVDALRELMR